MKSHAILVGIVGVSGSGKTTIANAVVKKLREEKHDVAYLRIDHYYKDNSHMTKEEKDNYNYDHPDALDLDGLYRDLQKLLHNQAIDRRIYSFASSTEDSTDPKILPAPIIIVEGLFLFADERIRKLFPLLYLVDTPLDCALARRITRETEQHLDIRQSLYKYETQIRPAALNYVLNFKKYAHDTLSNETPTIRDASVKKICAAIKTKLTTTKKHGTSSLQSSILYIPALLALSIFAYNVFTSNSPSNEFAQPKI